VVQVTVSRGQLAKIISKVSQALEQPYREVLVDLPGQARLNVDETGHKQNGERWWTWCFRAGLYTLFKIDPTRSVDVLLEVLGAAPGEPLEQASEAGRRHAVWPGRSGSAVVEFGG
jgi:transposase